MVTNPVEILVAEDDPDDRYLLERAFEENKMLPSKLIFKQDGEEAMEYLYNCSEDKYPGIILLDLNMPKKNGTVALMEIKNNAKLKKIPVLIFTSSNAEKDITESYRLGANSYITKPPSIDGLRKFVQVFNDYWLEVSRLPIKR